MVFVLLFVVGVSVLVMILVVGFREFVIEVVQSTVLIDDFVVVVNVLVVETTVGLRVEMVYPVVFAV